MSSTIEIEAAIARLPVGEREELERRLLERRFGLEVALGDDYQGLLKSLDEAGQEMDSAGGHSANELQQDVRRWAKP